MEAGPNWMWMANLLDDYGIENILCHQLKNKAIASARIKTDKLDSAVLSQLLRADFIPEADKPDRKTKLHDFRCPPLPRCQNQHGCPGCWMDNVLSRGSGEASKREDIYIKEQDATSEAPKELGCYFDLYTKATCTIALTNAYPTRFTAYVRSDAGGGMTGSPLLENRHILSKETRPPLSGTMVHGAFYGPSLYPIE